MQGDPNRPDRLTFAYRHRWRLREATRPQSAIRVSKQVMPWPLRSRFISDTGAAACLSSTIRPQPMGPASREALPLTGKDG
jgi:hypothetical protein